MSMDEDERGAEQFESSWPPPSESAEHGEAVALLQRILGALAAEHREVLVLSRLEELTVPEIADCLDANVNTIYSRLRVAAERFDNAHARIVAEDDAKATNHEPRIGR